MFALLDNYEECSAAFPTPTEYVRQQVPVVFGSAQEAVILK
ncbi:MAG: hypothetical protein PHP00_11630 [Thiotrichaceae bacterium]|nr:hypothetical protein [Thiotrichaceae bacterium]